MDHLSNSQELIKTAKDMGIYHMPVLDDNSCGLMLTESQLELITQEIWDDELTDQKILQITQSQEDPIWKELLENTSHEVAQVFLATLWDPTIWNWLALVPWINTTQWHNQKNWWLNRTTSTKNRSKKRNHPLNDNFPLHTDPSFYRHKNKIWRFILPWSYIKHYYGRFTYGYKEQPTDFFYLWDQMPDVPHIEQWHHLGQNFWYDSVFLHEICRDIRPVILDKLDGLNIPQTTFNRDSQYAWFAIHAPIEYPVLSDLPNQEKIYKNTIAHTWYKVTEWKSTWYRRDILKWDIEAVFEEYWLKGIK